MTVDGDDGSGNEVDSFRLYASRIRRDAALVMWGLGVAAACMIGSLVLPAPWSWVATGACAAALVVMAAGALGMSDNKGKPETWLVFLGVVCFVAAAFANAEPLASSALPVRSVSVVGMGGGLVLLVLAFLVGHLRFGRLERELDERMLALEDDVEMVSSADDNVGDTGEGSHADGVGLGEQALGEDRDVDASR